MRTCATKLLRWNLCEIIYILKNAASCEFKADRLSCWYRVRGRKVEEFEIVTSGCATLKDPSAKAQTSYYKSLSTQLGEKELSKFLAVMGEAIYATMGTGGQRWNQVDAVMAKITNLSKFMTEEYGIRVM